VSAFYERHISIPAELNPVTFELERTVHTLSPLPWGYNCWVVYTVRFASKTTKPPSPEVSQTAIKQRWNHRRPASANRHIKRTSTTPARLNLRPFIGLTLHIEENAKLRSAGCKLTLASIPKNRCGTHGRAAFPNAGEHGRWKGRTRKHSQLEPFFHPATRTDGEDRNNLSGLVPTQDDVNVGNLAGV